MAPGVRNLAGLLLMILRLCERELGEWPFTQSKRLAKILMVSAKRHGLISKLEIVMSWAGLLPIAWVAALLYLKRTGLIDWKERKQYRDWKLERPLTDYLITQDGKKAADLLLRDLSNHDFEETVLDLAENWQPCACEGLVRLPYRELAAVNDMDGTLNVLWGEISYDGKWTNLCTQIFFRILVLFYTDRFRKDYVDRTDPYNAKRQKLYYVFTPLMPQDIPYFENTAREVSQLQDFLELKGKYKSRIDGNFVQTKNANVNRFEIILAIWLYEVLFSRGPEFDEVCYLCLHTDARNSIERFRNHLNQLEDKRIIFRDELDRYHVRGATFYDKAFAARLPRIPEILRKSISFLNYYDRNQILLKILEHALQEWDRREAPPPPKQILYIS